MFEWDERNREHVQEHGVDPREVEQALIDPDRIGTAYRVGGERRWALIGGTEAGRTLFIVYTRRRKRIRVVSARNATTSEIRRYRARGK